MTDPRFAIVVTTIGDGAFLDVYVAKIAEEGLLERTTMIIIPDLKTPKALSEAVQKARRSGLRVEYPDLDEQSRYIGKLGPIAELIPENSDARRNIGFLMAYELGAEVIIAIDDDNLCQEPEAWLAEHAVVAGGCAKQTALRSPTGWFNVCSLLETSPAEIYPRGYPYAQRSLDRPQIETVDLRGRVDINAGLWLDVPDVDAFTHLAGDTKAHSLKASTVLAPGTWSPINTQNTAIRRDAMAAWWFVSMGSVVNGVSIQRFGDIFSGYFLLACANQVGGLVRFGTPLVQHLRNDHDFGRDALGEFPGINLLEDLLPWLCELNLDGETYAAAYGSLAENIEEFTRTVGRPFWSLSAKAFMGEMVHGMRSWGEAIRAIDGR